MLRINHLNAHLLALLIRGNFLLERVFFQSWELPPPSPKNPSFLLQLINFQHMLCKADNGFHMTR